jgi:hypothetical protein
VVSSNGLWVVERQTRSLFERQLLVLVGLQGDGWVKEGLEGSKLGADGEKGSKAVQESEGKGAGNHKEEKAPNGTHATVLKVG